MNPPLPAVVPERVVFTIDARHPDASERERLYARHTSLIADVESKTGLDIGYQVVLDQPPRSCDPSLVQLLKDAAADLSHISALLRRSGLCCRAHGRSEGNVGAIVRVARARQRVCSSARGVGREGHSQYVTPGPLDLDALCYWGATYWGIEADPVAARTGVATWLDAGSAGAYSFLGFRRYTGEAGRARLLALLNISSIGLIAHSYELSNLDYCDVDLGATIMPAQGPLLKDGLMG